MEFIVSTKQVISRTDLPISNLFVVVRRKPNAADFEDHCRRSLRERNVNLK